MSTKITANHERVDDIPVLIAQLKNMRVAELLDNHFPTNGNWTGMSLGWVTVVWLTFILSEGDHRLYRVEPWVKEHQRTLSRGIGRRVKPRDCTDDRLATVLDYLSVAARWIAFECELNESLIRVYHLQPRMARVDSTTAAAFVTPEGMFQLGHSKDHRPDLPQVKISMAVLDPLGLPLTTTVVAGNTADDPLYLPEIAKVRQIAQLTGLTYVGDCKMAAIGTRAEIVAHQDYYLCPLSATQVPPAELDRLLDPVFTGMLQPMDIRLPNAHGPIEEMDDPVAVGFAYTVEQSAKDQSGQMQCWQERHLVVRSLALATGQEKHLRERVARAVAAINALDERKQGKTLLPDEAAARQAAEAILLTQRGAGLVHVAVTTEVHEHVKRRYGTRPATTMRSERVRVSAATDEAALAQAARRLGWRVYATNHPAAALSVEQAVAAYRSEYLIEQGFGRLKGHSLSLTPLFLQYDHRVVGLVSLLSIALRVLVLVQFVVRRNLHTEGATLTGIYPGQPGRQTAQPTTEMLLRAFRGVTLSRIRLHGKTYDHMTPLNAVQQRILKLLEMPPDIYDGIVSRFSKTDFHSRET
jgi:transposase